VQDRSRLEEAGRTKVDQRRWRGSRGGRPDRRGRAESRSRAATGARPVGRRVRRLMGGWIDGVGRLELQQAGSARADRACGGWAGD
jgi:hypothetical protein